MIVHVLNANMYHLSPQIIRGLLTSFKDTIDTIVLLEDGVVNRGKYENIFVEFDFKDFIFTLSDFDIMVKTFQQYKGLPVIFHGGSYERWKAAFDAGCKNVNWICWGGDASKSVGRRKTQNFIKKAIGSIYDEWSYRKKKKLYKRFRSIVALIEPDRQTIVKDFDVSVDRIEVIPYRYTRKTSYEEITERLYNEGCIKDRCKPLVLIGNSPMNAPFYMQMLKMLKKYSGRIEVHCMYQYPHKEDKNYLKLLKLGEKYFGHDFFIDEKFLNQEEYFKYMNLIDVYICSNPEQTGIGAVNSLLLLGKKMYLKGKNFEYALGIGCSVHNIKDISRQDYEDFVKPDSKLIQNQNRDAIQKMYSQAYDKWSLYFKQINLVSSK